MPYLVAPVPTSGAPRGHCLGAAPQESGSWDPSSFFLLTRPDGRRHGPISWQVPGDLDPSLMEICVPLQWASCGLQPSLNPNVICLFSLQRTAQSEQAHLVLFHSTLLIRMCLPAVI